MNTTALSPAGETFFIKQLQLIAQLVAPVPSRFFVTSAHWGMIADEIRRDYPSSLIDPLSLPTPRTFKELQIGCLRVINAGTEDNEVVNLMNEEDADIANFAWKRDHLMKGRA